MSGGSGALPGPLFFFLRSKMLRSVQACQNRKWMLEIWPKEDPSKHQFIPFRCGSWRHAGDCRRFKGAQDFARIKEAMDGHSHWCHVVLTYPTKQYPDVQKLFRWGLQHWAKLRKRTQRRFGKYKYIQTWETTRKGWPHCHMVVSNANLYHECGPDPINNFHRLMMDAARECGFGKNGWCEPFTDHGLFAGYLVKLAKELTGQGKEYQIPTEAPPHFRRIRASRGLLPPVRKNPDYTGELRHFCFSEEELEQLRALEGAKCKGRMDAAHSVSCAHAAVQLTQGFSPPLSALSIQE